MTSADLQAEFIEPDDVSEYEPERKLLAAVVKMAVRDVTGARQDITHCDHATALAFIFGSIDDDERDEPPMVDWYLYCLSDFDERIDPDVFRSQIRRMMNE